MLPGSINLECKGHIVLAFGASPISKSLPELYPAASFHFDSFEEYCHVEFRYFFTKGSGLMPDCGFFIFELHDEGDDQVLRPHLAAKK